MEAARKACGKQQLAASVEHLQKAVEFDLEYIEARQELGRWYVRLDQPDNVIETFQGILKLDPRSADAYSFIAARRESGAIRGRGSRRAAGASDRADPSTRPFPAGHESGCTKEE